MLIYLLGFKVFLIVTLFQERHFNRTMKVLAEMEANEAKVVQKIEEDKQQILRETEEIRKKMRLVAKPLLHAILYNMMEHCRIIAENSGFQIC